MFRSKQTHLQELTLAKAWIADDEHMNASSSGDAVGAAHMLAHAPKECQQQAGLDQLMPIDRWAKRVCQVSQLLPLKFLQYALRPSNQPLLSSSVDLSCDKAQGQDVAFYHGRE